MTHPRWMPVTSMIAFVSSCAGASSLHDRMALERRDVQGWAIPPGASIVATSGPQIGRFLVQQQWEFSAAMDWDQYRQWLGSTYKGAYRGGATSEIDHVSFARALPGDRYVVEVVRVDGGYPVRVRISFVAIAD